jgi:hypothetical protein
MQKAPVGFFNSLTCTDLHSFSRSQNAARDSKKLPKNRREIFFISLLVNNLRSNLDFIYWKLVHHLC